MTDNTNGNAKRACSCGAKPGTPHQQGCDHALCPDCGQQRHDVEDEECPTPSDNPDRASMWHGLDPRAEVAQSQGWWTTAAGLDHPVEDGFRVIAAEVLGQITWNPLTQRYDIGHIDETAIDQALSLPPTTP